MLRKLWWLTFFATYDGKGYVPPPRICKECRFKF